jgi:hypothetical protein
VRESSQASAFWDPLSTPDIILPSQFFAANGAHALSSEQRLMLAVLVDAINILQNWRGNGSARKRGSFAEAQDWVLARGSNRPFSFENVCDGLGIEAEALRQRLADLRSNNTRLRLRLKQSGRAHNVTLNRVRHRSRRSRQRARAGQNPAQAPT